MFLFPFALPLSRAPVTSVLTRMLTSPKWLRRTQCLVLVSLGAGFGTGAVALLPHRSVAMAENLWLYPAPSSLLWEKQLCGALENPRSFKKCFYAPVRRVCIHPFIIINNNNSNFSVRRFFLSGPQAKITDKVDEQKSLVYLNWVPWVFFSPLLSNGTVAISVCSLSCHFFLGFLLSVFQHLIYLFSIFVINKDMYQFFSSWCL